MGRIDPEIDHLDRILSLEPILVGDLVLGEVLQGFRSGIDCLTATYCIETRRTLLHAEQDCGWFERRLGLRVIHPSP